MERAIDIFACAIAIGSSNTYPHAADRVGPLWRMRDAPRKNAKDYRREHWFVYHTPARQADRSIRRHTRGRFATCIFLDVDAPSGPMRDQWKSLGYRLFATQPVMIHNLRSIPRPKSPVRIERVRTQEVAAALGKATRRRPIPPEHLTDDAPFRQYVALEDGKPVGWVRSMIVDDATWTTDMYVKASHRRRGIARAMLARMLRDDRSHGSPMNLLTSTHTGALLYPLLGYKQIAQVMCFTPLKR